MGWPSKLVLEEVIHPMPVSNVKHLELSRKSKAEINKVFLLLMADEIKFKLRRKQQ